MSISMRTMSLTACGPAAILLIAGACGTGSAPDQPSSADTVHLPTMEAAARGPQPGGDLLIDEDGIGAARRGLTVGELRRVLPPELSLGALDHFFMVDVSAVPVIAGTDTLYHLLFFGLEALEDSMRLELVTTVNERARTPDGLGPGVTLAEAADRCGPLTLTYSVYDEAREYVVCPTAPGNIIFRTNFFSGDEMFAGVYSTDDEYNTTTIYDPAARITLVMVDLAPRAGQ
jgi:hypothetical protein